MHVVEAPGVRQFLPDRVRLPGRIIPIPHIVSVCRIAVAVGCRRSRTAGVFPLRFRRQVEVEASPSTQRPKETVGIDGIRRWPLRAEGRAADHIVRDLLDRSHRKIGIIGEIRRPRPHHKFPLLLSHLIKSDVERLGECRVMRRNRTRLKAPKRQFRRLVLVRVEPTFRRLRQIGDGVGRGVRSTSEINDQIRQMHRRRTCGSVDDAEEERIGVRHGLDRTGDGPFGGTDGQERDGVRGELV